MGTWLPTQAVTMKSFVLSSLFAVGLSAPTTHVNSGLPAGPLTPAFGDAVQTPKGLRSLALEGFSEDLNQDGFFDPIGQAVVAAPVAYTVPHVVSHPVAAVNTAVAPVAYHNVYAAAPVVPPRRLPRRCSRLHRAADQDCRRRPRRPVRRQLRSPHPLCQRHPSCCRPCCCCGPCC